MIEKLIPDIYQKSIYYINYDKLYKNGQLLTAYKLKLIHPTSKKEMVFEIKLPDYFEQVLAELR